MAHVMPDVMPPIPALVVNLMKFQHNYFALFVWLEVPVLIVRMLMDELSRISVMMQTIYSPVICSTQQHFSKFGL
jgi:hypothetical protein